MITLGAFEAKTRLSSLLDKVEAGETVTITRHGKPVARLIAVERADRERVDEVFDKLEELRRKSTLGGIDWKELRDAGRK
jgi:prevent-host-death family protein